MKVLGAEDRALQGWNLSADFWAKTGPRALSHRQFCLLSRIGMGRSMTGAWGSASIKKTVSSFAFLSSGRRLLGLIDSVNGDVEFENDAMLDQSVDSGAGCHRALEDRLPLGQSRLLLISTLPCSVVPPEYLVNYSFYYGGEGGIRTHVRISPKHAFQACAFNRSATSPRWGLLPA